MEGNNLVFSPASLGGFEESVSKSLWPVLSSSHLSGLCLEHFYTYTQRKSDGRVPLESSHSTRTHKAPKEGMKQKGTAERKMGGETGRMEEQNLKEKKKIGGGTRKAP